MRNQRAVMWDGLWQSMAVGVTLWCTLAGAGTSLNTLSGLEVRPTATGTQVVVAGSRAPTFTVFRLSEPERLVVDVSSADVSAIKGPHKGSGPVAGVVATQFSDERSNVGRLLVSLDHASQYDVRADGNKVVIAVNGDSSPASMGGTRADATSSSATSGAPTNAPEPNVVAAYGDERSVARPARHVIGVRVEGSHVKLKLDGELQKYVVLELANPSRVALDVFGVGMSARVPKAVKGPFASLRAGTHEDKIRFVVDLQDSALKPSVHWTTNGLEWGLQSSSQPDKEASPEVAEAEIDGQKLSLGKSETQKLSVKPPAGLKVADIKDIAFHERTGGGTVDLKLDGHSSFHVEHPDTQSAVLVLEGAKLPSRLERSLDTSALDTPVKMVSAFAVPGTPGVVRVVVASDGALEDTVEEVSSGLTWRMSAKGVKTESVAVSNRTAGFTSEAVSYASEGAPKRTEFSGKKVSFEFKDIDIHNLLRVIAEVSKRNVIVSDDVGGKVTIRLRNVPWDQALELILRSKSLGKEEFGNIIRVAPLATLEKEAQASAARKKAQLAQEELHVQLIPVNYGKADEMASRVKEVISERGAVSIDTRTNTVIVRDIRSGIEKSRSLIQTLDTPTPEVLIESRIVEANTTFNRQLGVQWGGYGQAASGTNNATGLVFPNQFRASGGVDPGTAPTTGLAANPNFAVNLPAAVGAGSGGALGFVFGSAGGALQLNLRLSALENTGEIKTISAPKVTTLDNMAAKISQGVSIPFSQVSASGVNTSFVEARLSLEVTPHITSDGSVIMKIIAQNNQPDAASTGANGQPAIQRKEANTEVLVKDGDTTVIGGIYVRQGSSNTAMVPWLGRIPIIGFFFRTDTQSETRNELLIFITPRILNRQPLAQGSL
jgi:type IV pilus assembly protein PilQ